MTTDLYSILEIPKDASEQDIKKAYRKLSLQYHPDRNSSPDADEKIRNINEAYETLSNPEKRRMYDLGEQPGIFQGGFPGFPGGAFHFSNGHHDINSMFNSFFNGGGGMPGIHVFQNGFHHSMPAMKPQPILHKMNISLEQAYRGCSIDMRLNRNVSRGLSVSNETDNFNFSIPAGSVSEEIVIIKEKGNVCENFKGDVHIIINIENKPPFKLHGKNLIYLKTLSLKESLCGCSFDILHPSGNSIKIEETTVSRPGHNKVYNGMGMRRDGQSPGDMIIEFSVIFPESLTSEQVSSLTEIL